MQLGDDPTGTSTPAFDLWNWLFGGSTTTTSGSDANAIDFRNINLPPGGTVTEGTHVGFDPVTGLPIYGANPAPAPTPMPVTPAGTPGAAPKPPGAKPTQTDLLWWAIGGVLAIMIVSKR